MRVLDLAEDPGIADRHHGIDRAVEQGNRNHEGVGAMQSQAGRRPLPNGLGIPGGRGKHSNPGRLVGRFTLLLRIS